MVEKKLILKGSLHGTKILKEYSKPDILYSSVNNKICKKNLFSISYNKEKNNFYIYHSYDEYDNQLNKIYSGRWYQTNFNFNTKSFDYKKKTLTIKLKNIEWENFETGKIDVKNVKIIIYLSPTGYEKIIKYLKKIIE